MSKLTGKDSALISRNDARDFVRNNAHLAANFARDFLAATRLSRLANEHKNSSRSVRVAFLLQYPKIWDKLEDVYEEMWKDERFEPVLVALPDPSVRGWDDVPIGDMSHDSEEYCAQRYSDRIVVRAETNDARVLDIHALGFDYVFYQRPYDSKLPKEYRSKYVSRWSRVCYMPYGYNLSPSFERMQVENTAFVRNTCLLFCESRSLKTLFDDRYRKTLGNRHRHFVYCGYPVLRKYLELGLAEWNSKCKKVLWTPRWSFDSDTGGSHFLEYVNNIKSLACSGFKVMVRPHPLMWSNLIESGLMDKKEIDSCIESLRDSGCILSESDDCLIDFAWSDVIIADYSSITLEYFLTGRPMIYCPPPFALNNTMERLAEGMYVAHSWHEVKGYLDLLQNGYDPKKLIRNSIVREEFADVYDAAKRIVDRVYEDYAQHFTD